jgi:starch phosphorylase
VIDIPDAELWETHQKLKLRLVNFVRDRVRARRIRLGESPESIRSVNSILASGNSHDRVRPTLCDLPNAARCFSVTLIGYYACSNDLARPVQFVFAGKAHPRDEAGKALIQQVTS